MLSPLFLTIVRIFWHVDSTRSYCCTCRCSAWRDAGSVLSSWIEYRYGRSRFSDTLSKLVLTIVKIFWHVEYTRSVCCRCSAWWDTWPVLSSWFKYRYVILRFSDTLSPLVLSVVGVQLGGMLDLCQRVPTDPGGAGLHEGLPLRTVPQGRTHSHDLWGLCPRITT